MPANLMPTDWHAAEPLVKEALDLEPTDPVARSLLAVLDDNRRQTAINIILAGARNYQADGHLADAMQIIERGLVQYPNDHRLIQFFTTLRAKAGQPPSPAARMPLPSAPPLPTAASESSPELAPPPVEAPPQNFFAPPNTDIPAKEPATPPQQPSSDAKSSTAADKTAAGRPKRPIQRPSPPPRRPVPPPQHDPSVLEELSFKGPMWIVAGVAALALILAAGVYQVVREKPIPSALPDARTKVAPTERYSVLFESNVPGTRFTEGDQALEANAELSAGVHKVEATHDGYVSDVKSFTIDPAANSSIDIKFELRPILPVLRLSSSIAHGRIVLDNSEPLDLQSGVASKDDLPIGTHTVKIFDGKRQVFAFSFETKGNEIPSVVAPLASQPVAGIVVASLAGSAKVYATAGMQASAALPVAPVPGSGLVLTGTATNPAHFFLDAGKGKGPQEQSVDASVFPTINVQLAGAVAMSSLSITTNAADCAVSVDGKPLSGQSLSVPLQPGNHPVKLSCPGFEDMEKVAVVKAGEISPHKLDFVMTPLPVIAATPALSSAPPISNAQLIISGAPPEAAVFQNQVRIGTVAADGTFAREIEPGTFTWEWRKANFETRRETRAVKAGEVLRIDGTMTPSTGNLSLKVVPGDAHITVRRDSDNSAIPLSNGVPLTLTAGSYEVSAEAPEYRPRSESVVIANGKAVTMNWELEKLAVAAGPVRFFQDGDSWKPFKEENGWWIHSGSGYSFLRASTGRFSLDFLRKKHSHKINIQADCDDYANCILYSIDGRNLTTKVISNGSIVSDYKKALGVESASGASFSL